jgi:hypothetical protein
MQVRVADTAVTHLDDQIVVGGSSALEAAWLKGALTIVTSHAHDINGLDKVSLAFRGGDWLV